MNKQVKDSSVLHRIISFKIVGDYRMRVEFDDATQQPVDFEPILFGPIFGPLRDPARFSEVELDPDFGALVWPNGADIDPMVLYDWPEYVKGIVARRQVAA